MPGDGDPPPGELADLAHHCESNSLELIIAADTNAHHPLWGSETPNRRGENLVTYLFSTNLNILNIGSEPTFVSSRYQTIVDVTFATTGVTDLISDWHVSNEPSCADHRRICFKLQAKPPQVKPRRNPRKTDRTKYVQALTQNFQTINFKDMSQSTAAIETNVLSLTTCITTSYEQACPLTSPPTRPRTSHWWGPELERLRRKIRKLFNRAKITRHYADWELYKEAQKHYKKRIRIRQGDSWRRFCENIESNNEAARVRKILDCGQNKNLGCLKKADKTYTNNDKETCQVLLETHFPDCRLVDDLTWDNSEHSNPSISDWITAQELVTVEKIEWAINSFLPFKSAGLDGIFPALLVWGQQVIVQSLANIFKACLAHNYIPKQWREVKATFIPKSGKSDYTDPKSYRPISLTSFLLKTLERLCDRHIRDNNLKQKPLHNSQHAYTAGKSTETALHSVVNKIECALTNKESTLGAFIDIEGAFDKTNFDSINIALTKYNVNPTLRGWINNMLKLRAVQLNLNGTTRCIVAKGCPQGGVLSPLLWNLVVDDLLRRLNSSGFYTVGYADDLTILISGKFENLHCSVMQAAMKIVEQWCREYRLKVNPSKTELVLFTNKRKLNNMSLPTLFGTQLTLSTEVKYLGITLDNKLNWNKHLDNKIKQATIAFWQCKRMLGKTWGLKTKLTLWLYKAVIRPTITYGSVVWWPRTELSSVKNKLQKLQRLACVAITGCMKSRGTSRPSTITSRGETGSSCRRF
ncbi:hypothetical protein JYU34_004438 [Plutella xylostella]|uniref:Reverse transcriptase domain-containing protein n=1 Tax=Plutella xylostella TaxID=51655 RepID=A0ABQ7QY05_PLUXY|nr:hypothetical protein JYU34_004438 [Plutella xylostella]